MNDTETTYVLKTLTEEDIKLSSYNDFFDFENIKYLAVFNIREKGYFYLGSKDNKNIEKNPFNGKEILKLEKWPKTWESSRIIVFQSREEYKIEKLREIWELMTEKGFHEINLKK